MTIEILQKRGPEARLPKASPSVLLYTTDSEKLFYGGGAENIEIAKKIDIAVVASAVIDHQGDKENPHGVTKMQVGLGSVEDYGVATSAEAIAGTLATKYMTPLLTKEVMDAVKEAIIAEVKVYTDNAINSIKNEMIDIIAGMTE